MAAGEEAATVFLKTSFGTRLAVSFPASATTVQDLKRRVSDEHATTFPRIGHITVQSFKVRSRGSWYHLTDSMAVRAAFHGIKGAWHLRAHVLPHSAAAHEDVGCRTHKNVLCAQHNAIGVPLLPATSQGALSDTPSTDQEDGHDHPGVASALAPHLAAGTSVDKCKNVEGAVLGENSDPDAASEDGDRPARGQPRAGAIVEPRGRKHFREENGDHDQSVIADHVCSIRQDDKNRCTHNSTPKRVCAAREDGLLDGVGVNSIGGSGDVVVISSDDEMLEDDEGLDFLETKKEETVSTRGSDQAETPVEELCDHETMSITNDKGSKLCFSVNENNPSADEGMPQEKLVEQQDHLDNGEESNSENPAPCFSVNKIDSTTATEEHADGGMTHEKLVEQQDHLDNGAEVLQNCHSLKDSSVIHPEYVSDCHQYEGSSRSFDLKCCKKSGCVCSEVERAPSEKSDRLINICGSVSATVGGCFDIFTRTPNLDFSEKRVNNTEQDYHRTDSVLESSIAEVCNSASGKKGTELPPCAETLKDVNSSEKEAIAHDVKGKGEWTARVYNGERSSKKETYLPPCVEPLKEVNYSEKEQMAHKVEEKEPYTATMSNGERSSNGTDFPPCVGSMKEGNSSEKEGVAPTEEKQRTRTVTLVDVDGTKWEVELDDSFEIGTQESSSNSDAEAIYSHLAKPGQNAEECLDGIPENGGTRASTERSHLPRHGSFKTPTSSDPTGSKDGEGTSSDSTEQVAWDGTRWPRHVVRKNAK